MEDHFVPVDALEQRFAVLEAEIAERRAEQLALTRTLDIAQVSGLDGCRTMADWLCQRFDLHPKTARRLLRMAHTTNEVLERELSEGLISTDRAAVEAKLIASGATEQERQASRRFDVNGVERMAGRRRKVTARDEHEAHMRRRMTIQRRLDGASGTFWGEAPSFDLDVIERSLDRRADQLYGSFSKRPPRPTQHLDAFVSLSQDALVGAPTANDGAQKAKTVAVVTVDATAAAPTDGEAGAEMLEGGRVGPATLDRIRCSGVTEVNVRHADGTTCQIGPTKGALNPRQVRRILARDGGRCQIDGCTSTYGLEVHHLVWRCHGGSNHDRHLATICWVHHHRMIHGEGMKLDPDSPRTRLRFLRWAGPEPPDD